MTWICWGMVKLSLTAALWKLMLSQMKKNIALSQSSHTEHRVRPVSHGYMHMLLYHNHLADRINSALLTVMNFYIHVLQVLRFS